jgi:glyoxylase-like metal-dependent hydrolase (beta-lactamase superfamily II)
MARTANRLVAKRLVIASILLFGIGATVVYLAIVGFDSERVGGDVSVIYGAGGNVGVLRSERGAVVVDTMTFALQGRQIRELAERLGGGPTQAVINTHYHRDHTHGNPGFAPGTKVVSTGRTRDYLLFFDEAYWQGDRAGTLPNDTFDAARDLRIGDKTVRLVFAGPGHTGGDLVVLFVEDRVLHAGDLFFHKKYPRVDFAGGGSIPAWIETLGRVLELEFDRVIPGHGAVTGRESLVEFREFLRDVWVQTGEAVLQGKSPEETLATVDLKHDDGYGVGGVPILREFDRDSIIRQAWEEASGNVTAVDVPDASP